MTPRRMVLAAVLALTVVFLSPIAYMAGERAGLWLTSPAAEPGPWPSVDDAEQCAFPRAGHPVPLALHRRGGQL